MKLAISNIGWTNEEEADVAELLRSMGVKYVEIAPTKTWSEPIVATDAEVNEYKHWWKGYGIEIVAFQSMLFSHPEYKIFESNEGLSATEDYLKSFTKLAGKIGAGRMVFGSPKNRQKNDLNIGAASDLAVGFFNRIADVANENGVVFCIEPNAPQYNCDFITNAQQGIDFVKRVNNPGFGLHLDIACMTLAGDDVSTSINRAEKYLKHFHISSPMLEQVEDREDIRHKDAASALRRIGFSGYVSIEMRPGDTGTNVDRVRRAVEFAQKVYF